MLCIVGPTASGKSALAVELARTFDGEIVSADSRQVYRGLDIGSGKITKQEMCGIPHHLLDVASPTRTFTAHDFAKKARVAIADIEARHKLPIVVGGTGFYIDALVGRIPLSNVPINTKLRAQLEKIPTEKLLARLRKINPARADTIEPHNKRRIIRALEIAHTPHAAAPSAPPPYEILWLGIAPPFTTLEEKITARLYSRIRVGMIAEARRLRADGLSFRRMESLGLEYRSLARLLQEKISREEFETELVRAIRRFAKRQITYWRRNTSIHWFDPSVPSTIIDTVATWLLVDNKPT